jgi:hypothetical protein
MEFQIQIEIIDSWAFHARELYQTLRKEDTQEAIRSGLEPEKAILYSYRSALYRKTALINGDVAAMWGVCGTPLSMIGQPYLITGELVHKVSPIKFTRIYTQEVQVMKGLFPSLINYVDAEYTGAVRLLRIAGFDLEGPMMLNGNEFYRFSMTGEN